MKGPLHEDGLDLEFYKEAIKRFEDDESIPALFDTSMVEISTKLGTISMEDDYKPYMQVCSYAYRLLLAYVVLWR